MSDNQQKKMSCPICGGDNDVSAAYCIQCAWEFKVFPSTISQFYQTQENERRNKAKEYIDALLRKVNVATEEKKQIENELEKVEQKLIEAETVIRASKDDLKAAKEELRLEIIRQSHMSPSVVAGPIIKGIVSIKNIKTDNLCYMLVYDGLNTYGSAPDDGNHHEIKMRMRGINLLPIHFSVETRNGRLCLRDLSSGTMTYNTLPISSNGVYTEARTIILLDKTLEIHISEI